MTKIRSMGFYNELIEKINQYEVKLLEKYRDDIACREGCDSCCILESVFPVEAYVIYKSLLADERIAEDISIYQKGRCVFLHDGGCSIYSVRPVICRTHGYPVLVDGRIDFCPENFRGRSSIDSEYILDLENLNRALASINLIFCSEVNADFFKRDRIGLKEIVEFVINK